MVAKLQPTPYAKPPTGQTEIRRFCPNAGLGYAYQNHLKLAHLAKYQKCILSTLVTYSNWDGVELADKTCQNCGGTLALSKLRYL